jgi:hypothetical protein
MLVIDEQHFNFRQAICYSKTLDYFASSKSLMHGYSYTGREWIQIH